MNPTMRNALYAQMAASLFGLSAHAQFAFDARILEYTGLRYVCGGVVTPVLKIQNNGSFTMNTCVVETWKNGLLVNNFNWILAVPAMPGQVRQPSLPPVGGGVQADDVLEFRIISVNEQPDEDPDGNILQQPVDEEPAFAESHVVVVEVLTDDAPEETIWAVHDATGAVLASGGPYANANSTEEVWLTLPISSCLDLRVSDAGGDGLGTGHVRLLSNGAEVFSTAGQGDFNELRQGFITGTITGVDEHRPGTLRLVPNPVTDLAHLDARSLPQPVVVEVMDASGRQVSGATVRADAMVVLSTAGWMTGLYTVVVRDAGGGVHPVRFVRQ
jgi:hypothetical protein